MSRRAVTLLVSGVLVLVLGFLALVLPVPYVVLSPGPTLNTLGKDGQGKAIITVTGHPTNDTTGNLNLTTVNENSGNVTMFQALLGWLRSDHVVVPRAALYPPGTSSAQVTQQNTEDFSRSQDSATAAAACELGYPKGFGITSVDPKLGSAGHLRSGDSFVSVNGEPTATPDALSAVLKASKPGDTVTVVIERAGVQVSEKVVLSPPSSGSSTPRLGVAVTTGCLMPFEVDLGLNSEIGGPSAGLMFALGIMDKVGPQDLTDGKFIAGTGEISPAGVVGPIGGIALKMIAARRAGATVFLAPASNCSDVVGHVPAGLQVIKVGTLHEAHLALLDIQQNKSAPHC